MVELQALGQRGGHDVDPGVDVVQVADHRVVDAHLRKLGVEVRGTRVRDNHADRAWFVGGCPYRFDRFGQGRPGDPDDLELASGPSYRPRRRQGWGDGRQ